MWELKPQRGQQLVQVGEWPLLEQSTVVKERSAAVKLGSVPATRPQSFHFAQAGAYVMGESPRNSVLLADAVKNYRSASVLVCKQSLLVLSSNGKVKQVWLEKGWQKQGGHRPAGQGSQCGKKSQEGQESKSFILRMYTVGGVRVKKLYID